MICAYRSRHYAVRADLHLIDTALADFIAQVQVTSTELSMLIGMRRDAEFTLDVAANLLTAHLTLLPAQGGKVLQVFNILEALKQKGNIFGILLAAISKVVLAGECDRILIASGQRVGTGTAGYFDNLLLKKE